MGCEAIKNLCLDDSKNADQFRSGNVCDIMLEILKTHGKDSTVVFGVLEVIHSLTYQNKLNRMILGTVRTCLKLSEACRYHKNNSAVMDLGYVSIGNLLIGMAEKFYDNEAEKYHYNDETYFFNRNNEIEKREKFYDDKIEKKIMIEQKKITGMKLKNTTITMKLKNCMTMKERREKNSIIAEQK